MPNYLHPAADKTALEALGMEIDTVNRVITLPAGTFELDLPLNLQDWTMRGVRRNVWTKGSVIKASDSFQDPEPYGALAFVPSARVDIDDVIFDANGRVDVALELDASHGSHLTRVVGAHAPRACIAIRNSRGLTATQCMGTGWNEPGRIMTGTGWLIEKFPGPSEQKPSQNVFLNCKALWCGGDGVQIEGDINKWIGGTIDWCEPVDAQGNTLTMRVEVAPNGESVTYEQETSPGVWSAYTNPAGPGIGINILRGDSVHISGVYFEAPAVDCIVIAGRYHIIENCIISHSAAPNVRTVRLLGGWRSSVVRCTMRSGTNNRVAIHGDSFGSGSDAVGVHILRYGGNPVIFPFVGDPVNGTEQGGTHHTVAYCSVHSTSASAGPGVEVNNVEVPQ